MAANQPSDPAPDAKPSAERLRFLTANAPRHTTYGPAYTQIVRRLRVILPVAALLAVAVAVLWPYIKAGINRPTEPTQRERSAQMIDGRFVGADAQGRPYTVTYDAAEQSPTGGPIELISPLAESMLESGAWIALRAAHGSFDQGTGTVDLTGRVEFFHDEGYRFTTEHARIEFNKDIVWSDRLIEGHGPKGQIIARGFRASEKGKTIVFTGPAKLTLRLDAAQLPQPVAETR